MGMTLDEKIASLSAARQQKINLATEALIAEEQTIQDLRKALSLTQASMAKTLGIRQESVSRIEKRSDLLISTLESYVNAMGGKLRLVAEFPDRPPVTIKGIHGIETDLAYDNS
jgi:DNA-binding XRE family transcriptional regulator